MGLTNAARDLELGTFRTTITHFGLANEAGTELSGGSPAYARKAVTWTAVSGAGTVSNTAAIEFDVGGTSGTPLTVARVLLRGASSGGTDYGSSPVGGFSPMVATVDAATDAFTNYSHGLANGDRVYFSGISGGSVPTGLSASTLYTVSNVSPNTFQVTNLLVTTNITASGECWVQRCVPEIFSSQGTYTLAAGDIDVDATAI